MTLGQWLKQERQKLGFTLLDLEVLSGISKSTISRIERDESAKLRTLNALAKSMDLSFGDYYHPSAKKE